MLQASPLHLDVLNPDVYLILLYEVRLYKELLPNKQKEKTNKQKIR